MKSSSQIPRIRSYLTAIEERRYSRNGTLMLWRLLISAAHDGFEVEVAELDSLKFAVVEDPSLTGEPVG